VYIQARTSIIFRAVLDKGRKELLTMFSTALILSITVVDGVGGINEHHSDL